MTTRLLLIGGFLGAGKTTTLARLARRYTDQGLRVGLVTNDQAYDLVDTHTLRSQGFDVGEVPGACFCCKFDDLITVAEQLGAQQPPDIILAEPVGSCTDLAATVIEPLRSLFGRSYRVGPLAVLLKPEHGRKILRDDAGSGFSPKAAYIFLKQIEEADIVAINKTDKLSAQERDELIELVRQRYPDKTVVAISARQGDGFDDFQMRLEGDAPARQGFMEVDYQTYAEGEAELGWLNCLVELTAAERFALQDIVLQLVENLREQAEAADVEAAHLKVLGQSASDAAVANLVASGEGAELSHSSGGSTQACELVVNARMATSPEWLEAAVREGVQQVAHRFGCEATVREMQRFRPAPPVPVHRYQ